MANKFGAANAVSHEESGDQESREDTPAANSARITDSEAVTDYHSQQDIDEWDKVRLHHLAEDDVWEARFNGVSGRGNSQIDALDELVVELRDRDSE